MSLIDNELRKVWNILRERFSHAEDLLLEINVRKMRGINDLRVPFGYPVTVLAGQNACGKSTVLFGCAAAYKKLGRPAGESSPSNLFPRYSHQGADARTNPEIEYAYISQGKRMSMKWGFSKSWSRSYFGRKKAQQPEREVYLRTLASLTNPSEVRKILQINRQSHQVNTVPDNLLALGRRVLPFKYEEIHMAEKEKGVGDLLLATLEQERGKYSEFHMASGERSMLRLSMEIGALQNALVLIDEIETGLHPHIQKLLMLNLQQMAVRQNLQIIVTTHSPIILDCVPPEGRKFLSRDESTHDVRVEAPLRDILQKAMYGQSDDKLSIVCEDEVAEAIIRGVADALSRKVNFGADQIIVGRDTGRDEFKNHVRTLAMLGKLSDIIFVLDGDARNWQEDVRNTVKEQRGQLADVLVLPGDLCPEEWLWSEIKERHEEYGKELSIPGLLEIMNQIEKELNGGWNRKNYKERMFALAQSASRGVDDIARRVACYCAEKKQDKIVGFANELEDAIEKWRHSRL